MTSASLKITKHFKNVLLWGWYTGFWAICGLAWLIGASG